MFTIKTATGKEFKSTYATRLSNPSFAFIRIVDSDAETVKKVFSNEDELPIEGYEEFRHLVEITEESHAVKLMLEP